MSIKVRLFEAFISKLFDINFFAFIEKCTQNEYSNLVHTARLK